MRVLVLVRVQVRMQVQVQGLAMALALDLVPGQTRVELPGLLAAYRLGLGQYLGPTTSELLFLQTFRSAAPQRYAHT